MSTGNHPAETERSATSTSVVDDDVLRYQVTATLPESSRAILTWLYGPPVLAAVSVGPQAPPEGRYCARMTGPSGQTTTPAPAGLTARTAPATPAGVSGVGVAGHCPPGACSQAMSRQLGKLPESMNAVTVPAESTWSEGARAIGDRVDGGCQVGAAAGPLVGATSTTTTRLTTASRSIRAERLP